MTSCRSRGDHEEDSRVCVRVRVCDCVCVCLRARARLCVCSSWFKQLHKHNPLTCEECLYPCTRELFPAGKSFEHRPAAPS